jgi:hypothetical protein
LGLFLLIYRRMLSARVLKGSSYTAGKAEIWPVLIIAIVLLVLTGATYRFYSHKLRLSDNEPIKLPVPLSVFPTQIGNWIGFEQSIPATTREYMERNFADDFFSRRYVNSADKIWADVYVVYCSTQPGGILGHRPGVCYPAHGWSNQNTKESQFISQNGQKTDCLIQRFRQPWPANDEVIVLSFYICNGRTTAKESDFSSVFNRRVNIAKDPGRYVAQVQISSVMESSVRKAAQDMTDVVLTYLPDENGKVRAEKITHPVSDSSKRIK